MKIVAIIALLSCYCHFLFSQGLTYSKVFETKKESVPIAILNNHPDYFHVLRYNKLVHDFTIEKRTKKTSDIIAFTPLQLEKVNERWFDYEKLDYLWFETNGKICFVFEKVLNSKSTVFLKIIDSLGMATDFIELGNIERGEDMTNIHFSFYRTEGNNVLAVGSSTYINNVAKKSAVLYDVNFQKVIWKKKLPVENPLAEFTGSFMVNKSNDLFYVHYNIRSVIIFKSEKGDRREIDSYGDINLMKIASDSKTPIHKKLSVSNICRVYSSVLIPQKSDVLFCGQLVEFKRDNIKLASHKDSVRAFFYAEKMTAGLDESSYSRKHYFPVKLRKQLTFYGGSNDRGYSLKNYKFKNYKITDSLLYFVTERKDGVNYNELINWRIDIYTGDLKEVGVIPRRVVYFKGGARYKQAGEAMVTYKRDSLKVYVLEHNRNLEDSAANFSFSRMKKKQKVFNANIVCYNNGVAGPAVKSFIYREKDFYLIPLNYSSENKNDDVFYFNKGNKEKFGFISLQNPL